MGGLGSGRPAGRSKVEHHRSLDVNRLARHSCLEQGYSGVWEWKQDGQRVAWIKLAMRAPHLCLSFRIRMAGSDWEDISQKIFVGRAACHFGGSRYYFTCPGVVNGVPCYRRVVKLHGAGRYFLCRQCYRLSYSSQSELPFDRMLRRANKLRRQLGGDPGMAEPIAQKPKGMWHRTYERKLDAIFAAEDEADSQIAIYIADRFGLLNGFRK